MFAATTSAGFPAAYTNFSPTKTISIPNRLSPELKEELTDRQERLSWWRQKLLQESRILQIGAGGLGGPIAKTLVQMGAAIDVLDHDIVEVSNLNRQLFTTKDLGKPKPHALLDNISPYATSERTLHSYWTTIQDFVSTAASERSYAAYSAGVDNDDANIAVAKYAIRTGTTAIFTNVSRDGDACRVFVQRAGEACFVCYKPHALTPEPSPGCLRTPAIADILQVAAGLAVRAVVGELMGEPIGDYNCRDLSFSGFDYVRSIERRPDCPVCGGKNDND